GLLGLGDATPLLRLYLYLPPGEAVIRGADRLVWITGLSMGVLTAFGLDAIAARDTTPRDRWLQGVAALVLAGALFAFAPAGLRRAEIIAVLAIVAAVLAGTVSRRLRPP